MDCFDPADLVRERVRRLRADGRKNSDAIAGAARDLGLSERAVRGLLYGEMRAALAESYEALCARFARSLDADAARLEREASALRQRASAMLAVEHDRA
jgi:hypothetical protein